ncbi:MAG: hypothetical protein ACXAAM_02855 [Candidatus Heimdallarchaeaceae archaeon]|jgi:hypothetical protein
MKTSTKDSEWFNKWSKKTLLWASICFLLIASINGLMSFLFDVLLFEIEIGYVYIYFTIIFFTGILYFFYVKFKSNWFGLFAFGLSGLIGVGIELWLEYYKNPILKSVWGAIGWGIIYILYGLGADLSMYLVKVMKREQLAIILSSLIFSLLLIVFSIIPLEFFYVPGPEGAKDFLTFWYFLIPYGLIQGVIGAYAGMFLAKERRNKTSIS